VRVLSVLKPGGYFCIGHSETLHEISSAVEQIAPSIYRKP
jgi:chemotaxis protein methyltransferase CheR